jgi:hypothetical protein
MVFLFPFPRCRDSGKLGLTRGIDVPHPLKTIGSAVTQRVLRLLFPWRRLRIRVRRQAGALVLDVRGVIDDRFPSRLEEAHGQVGSGKQSRVVVNLSQARVGDRGAPTELCVHAYNLFAKDGDHPLRVVTDGGRIEHLLRVQIPTDAAGTVFEYYQSEEEALGP